MAVMAKVVVLVLVATFSNVICFPKREAAHEVEVSTTPSPNNQTQTEAVGGASEDVEAGTPAPIPHNQTATAQPDVTDGPSEDDVVTASSRPQNQTTPAAQTENAETDGPSEDGWAEMTVTTSPQNQTTAAAQTENAETDGPSEDDVVTATPCPQNKTTSCATGGVTECFPHLKVDVDFPGSDVKQIISTDELHCQRACSQHPSCQFFSFLRPDWTRDSRRFYCYLKHTDSGKPSRVTKLKGVTSGYSLKNCKETTESPDEPSDDAEVAATTQNAQNQTTLAHTGTDGPSEDAVLTTVLNLQNGTTPAQDVTAITDSHNDS
ncbi:uncharacterized protein LOC134071536 isoform X1 [Sardina pilchardus]|uniref:uncharacterized protein LOC134071536 isoform X1 n=1 Tax=Sardina pilchardus TaxID=27697 RepID=UPI002E0D795D